MPYPSFWLGLCVLISTMLAGSAHAYIIEGRWSRTATNSSTGSRGTPITVTWSFAPDGTLIPGNTSGTVPSNLLSFLDTNFGAGPGGSDLTQRPWFPIFSQSTARISALSGVTFVYEPNDDGRAFSNLNIAQGVLGVRGDIRLGGKSFGAGSNTLASNYYPDYGEMMINTDKASFFTNSTNNYRLFRNTLMHELLHGLGISHIDSSNAAFLMEPTISGAFDGPQLDDLLALQRNYGDIYEKNGGNDTYDRATPLGQLSPTQSLAIGALGSSTSISPTQVDFLSIDDDSDTDFFSFSITSRYDVRMQLSPRGTSYQVGPEGGTQTTLNTLALSNLSLALMDTNGTSLLALADANGAGLGEEIIRQLLPGTYYARVKGSADNIQLYGLNLFATAPLPRDLVWVGNINSTWNVGVTANFSDAGTATVFYEFDNATFNDTSAVKTVNLSGNIEAGTIRVTTASSYTFSGSGAITAGSLTVDGTGVVTLANSGNSYSGATQVLAGTLRLTGNASAMVSPITVANGARLSLDATNLGTLGSSLSIAGNGGGNGAIHVAAGRTANITGNVTLASSTAAIHADTNASATFQGSFNGAANNARLNLQAATGANLTLQGNVSLAAGGITKQGNGTSTLAGSLSYSGATFVDQGTLRLTGSGLMGGAFHVAQAATLELAGTHQFQFSARLTGTGLVNGDVAMPGTIAPGNHPTSGTGLGRLTLANNLNLSGTSLLTIDLGGTQGGQSYDVLTIGGEANLNGALEVSLFGGFSPALGNSFEVLYAAGGIFGQFNDVVLPTLSSQLAWSLVYSNFAVLLQVVASNANPLPGDYNNDGIVDTADYLLWRKNPASFGGDPAGYNTWHANFGATAGGGAAELRSAAVPEPSGLALLMLAALWYARPFPCRRRALATTT